jgi:hypothetical protein
MPPKKRRAAPKRRTAPKSGGSAIRFIVPGGQHGEGFFDDAGRWIKGAVGSVRGYADAVRKFGDKLPIKPSTLIGFIPHPAAKGVAAGARLVGLGKKRRVVRRKTQRGGSAASGMTSTGMIVQRPGTGFNTMPLSLNGGGAGRYSRTALR